jgi:hypothetical protein
MTEAKIEVRKMTIEINGENVFALAKAMDKAIDDDCNFVEFEGEQIPTQVVGEILTEVALRILAHRVVDSMDEGEQLSANANSDRDPTATVH